MITNLEIVDDDVAKAFGQKFDVSRVLDAMIGFVTASAATIRAAAPHAPMNFRVVGDGDASFPIDGDAYARLRAECAWDLRRWDAADFCGIFKLGTLALRLYPLGTEHLQRYGSAPPTTIDEGSWRDLDATPVIRFMPASGGMPFLEPAGVELARSLMALHAPADAKPSLDGVPTLRFPHHAYGLGLGDVRIRLLTIPVEP